MTSYKRIIAYMYDRIWYNDFFYIFLAKCSSFDIFYTFGYIYNLLVTKISI